MFLSPLFLWLLIGPLLLFAWQCWHARRAGARAWLTAGLRCMALVLLILAIANPYRQAGEPKPIIVAVVDVSSSMDETALSETATHLRELFVSQGRDKVRLVVFSGRPAQLRVEDVPPSAADLLAMRSDAVGSDLSSALDFAAALCPHDDRGVIHLFSDGRAPRVELMAAAARLGRRGLVLETHVSGASDPQDHSLLTASGPGTASVGQAVMLTAEVDSRGGGPASLRVSDEAGQAVTAQPLTLTPGVNQVVIPVRPGAPGLQTYRLTLEGSGRVAHVALDVKTTVVGVIESAPDAPATAVLRSLLGEHAQIQKLDVQTLTPQALRSIDVVALADTPADELPEQSQRHLRAWVENGGGLLVTGGRNAFGPGGYANSELAAALPLRFPQDNEVRDPSTALAVIIDTSGSMGVEGVSLAKEVARLALKRLKPHDKAGIVEFHGAKRWAAPLQSASNSIAIQRALDRLSAGGGTVLLPAIEEAYYAMLNVRARTRHVMILTDGGVEESAYEPLLRRMSDDGIQVHTVLVGPRAGTGFLVQIASWGGGQFFTAPSRFQLPEVIAKQPSTSLLEPFVETPTEVQAVISSRLTRGLDLGDAPALGGYVKTRSKDTTELILQSELGDPVLARWHYGLGRVAVLTTGLNDQWAGDLLRWKQTPDLLANLTRQLAGDAAQPPLGLVCSADANGLDIQAHAYAVGRGVDRASEPLRVCVRDASGELFTERLVLPVRADVWQTRFNDLPPGACVIEIMAKDDDHTLARAAVSIPGPEEYTRLEPDAQALGAAEETARIFAANRSVTDASDAQELWQACAALSLVLFLLMVLARRWPVPQHGKRR